MAAGLWSRVLVYSSLNGLPVRVIRGEGYDSPYSPSAGYRYDGLYLVDDYWQDRGRAGFLVWRYRLIRLPFAAVMLAVLVALVAFEISRNLCPDAHPRNKPSAE